MVGVKEADMVLKESLRVLLLDPKATGSELCVTEHSLSKEHFKAHPQWHITFKEDTHTPPKSATPYASYFLSNYYTYPCTTPPVWSVLTQTEQEKY